MLLEHQPDGSIASCRNAAAERARGEWLLFLDADDRLAPGYVQAMTQTLPSVNGRSLLTPRVSYVAGRGGYRHRSPTFWPEVDMRGGNWLVIGTLVRRDFFFEVGGFRDFPHGLEDWNLWARCVRAGATIVKVPGAVYIAHFNKLSKHHQLGRDREAYVKAYNEARCDAWPELCE